METIGYLPKAEMKAQYSGVGVAEWITANSSPSFVVQNFHSSSVAQAASCQSH